LRKDRQYDDQAKKNKKTNYDSQNMTQKNENLAIQTPQQN